MKTKLSFSLEQAIAALLRESSFSGNDLQRAAEQLSQDYRTYQFDNALQETIHAISYIAVRLPATYAVMCRVLQQLPAHNISSLTDLGAGPGTVFWAAQQCLPLLESAILIERHADMIDIGKQLLEKGDAQSLSINWYAQDIGSLVDIPEGDLITLSYALGEIPMNSYEALLKKVYNAAHQFMVIVEPGTPRGFKAIQQAREILLREGAFTVAPCTHDQGCPLKNQDWCHFSERVSRSDLHRQIKEGSLNYEDEKYSYVIMSKHKNDALLSDAARVIKKPLRRSGHIALDICDAHGIKREIYSRKDKILYRQVKKLNWGDILLQS